MSQITFFGRGCGALDNAISNTCVVPTSAIGVGTIQSVISSFASARQGTASAVPPTRRIDAGLQPLRASAAKAAAAPDTPTARLKPCPNGADDLEIRGIIYVAQYSFWLLASGFWLLTPDS